jgi:hypothetical protein
MPPRSFFLAFLVWIVVIREMPILVREADELLG